MSNHHEINNNNSIKISRMNNSNGQDLATKSNGGGGLEDVVLDVATQRLINLTTPSSSSDGKNNRNQDAIEEIISIIQRKAPKLLDGLTEHNKVQIARQCQLKLYANNEIVFRQGDEPDAYYTVIRGAVSIYALNSSLRSTNTATDSRDEFGVFITQVPPGESFGELSFNENGPHSRRNAGIISDGSHGQARIRRKQSIINSTHNSPSSQPCHQNELTASDVCVLLLIPEQVYMSEMYARHSAKHQTKDKIEFLKKSALFKHWTMDQMVKLAYAMKKKQYAKGSTIIQQGERMEYLWIIREGVVRISHRIVPPNDIRSLGKGMEKGLSLQQSGNKRGKGQQALCVDFADLGKNDVIGLIEGLEPAIRKSQREVVALRETEMFFLPLSLFKSFLSQDAKTLLVAEKVVERRKAWEALRKEYATKFPKMVMSLPKGAFSMSNYAMDGCEEPMKARRKSGGHSNSSSGEDNKSNAESLPSRIKSSDSTYSTRNPAANTTHERGDIAKSTSCSGSRGRAKGDRLMRKNRENTLDLLVAEAGL